MIATAIISSISVNPLSGRLFFFITASSSLLLLVADVSKLGFLRNMSPPLFSAWFFSGGLKSHAYRLLWLFL
jgi:hypothetical protein